jgi:hypothetical protein
MLLFLRRMGYRLPLKVPSDAVWTDYAIIGKQERQQWYEYLSRVDINGGER